MPLHMLFRILPALAIFLSLASVFPLPAFAQKATIPGTQNEQMNDPQPLTRVGPNGEPMLVARGRSVLIRPGLAGLYITDEGQPRVIADTRQEFILERGYNSLRIRPLSRDEQIMLPARDVIPDGRAGKGNRTIAEAWLIQPTNRYDHGALGDDIEAGALRIITKANKFAIARLNDGSVFEGTQPLVGDVDGDGTEEVLVINSNAQGGSAIHIYKVVPAASPNIALEQMAVGPRMGRKNLWINPVGIGDFDLDGRPEILVVNTPHENGVLVAYQYRNGQLVEVDRYGGISNHAVGSPQTDMQLIQDITGDNRPDIIIPSADRETLRILTMDAGKFKEIGVLHLPSPVKTNILWVDNALTLGLEDNSVLSLSVFIQ